MKQFIFILLLSGSFLKPASGQTAFPAGQAHKKSGEDCVYKQKYTAGQRSKFYPFNIAATVKLASFRYFKNKYPIKEDTVLYDSLIEIKALTKSETNNLTDILYNNFRYQQPRPVVYKGKKYYTGATSQCFFPRNAILFFDQKGCLKDFILICFHCSNQQSGSGKGYFGETCTGKIEKLRQFFISLKVVFGTDLNIEEYPGEDSYEGIVHPAIKNN